MLNFYIIKYMLKANFYILKKNYNKVLRCYVKNISHNLCPKPKLVDYDKKIGELADNIIKKNNYKIKNIDVSSYNSKRILILCTEIYDSGGHTECALNYINLFHNEFELFFYLTDIFYSGKSLAPEKSKIIKSLVKDFYYSDLNNTLEEKIFELFNYIINNKITTVNVNMHMQDVVGCSVLYLLQKYTNINIVFWNHADHYYSLGTKYAHTILSRCYHGKPITPYLANQTNVLALPFLIRNKNNKIKNDIREQFSIPPEAFVTMTGCIETKLNNEYFKLIKKILDTNKNIYHIWVCSLPQNKKNKIYKKFNLDLKRFIITDFVSNFDDYINSSDIYIDSFPQGSALTLVDCIRLAKPVVIKVNTESSINSFEEYLYPDYELSCKTVKEMFDNILKLSNDKEYYNKIKEKVSKYFIDTYTNEKIKPLYEVLVK